VKSGTYALVGGTIVDGTGRPAVPDGVVMIRGRPHRRRRPPRGDRPAGGRAARDVAGKDLVPGLWDMHTHVTQIEWAPVYLAAGVTTVRDMGNEFEFIVALRRSMASRRSLGPRLLLAGLVDGPGPNAFGVYEASTPEEGRRSRRQIRSRPLRSDQDLLAAHAATSCAPSASKRTAGR
jgi:imidazolonepropionase-like amidohydrolase